MTPPDAPFRPVAIAVAGGRLAACEAGAGAPLVVLADAPEPRPTRTHALLAASRRVVLLGSGAPAGPVAARAASILSALGGLGIVPCDLMGQGSGADLALAIALEAGESVRALVLMAPTTIGGPSAALEGRLSEIAQPSLALFGTKDMTAPPETARLYRERMPDCNLALVYDAGHAMDAERPEAVAAVIAEFLERHDHFLVRRDSGIIYP